MIAGDTIALVAMLTGRQAEVLGFAARYYEVVGEGCPVPVLARKFHLARTTVRAHVGALYRKGWLLSPGSVVTPARPYLSRD